MDGIERERKLDDLAVLLRDYLATVEDIVSTVNGEDAKAFMTELYRRVGLQPIDD